MKTSTSCSTSIRRSASGITGAGREVIEQEVMEPAVNFDEEAPGEQGSRIPALKITDDVHRERNGFQRGQQRLSLGSDFEGRDGLHRGRRQPGRRVRWAEVIGGGGGRLLPERETGRVAEFVELERFAGP
ncbi:hypothetical protein EVJ50_02095 [Synechococcus sp. RSCCF101]|uniref:hypothetical protein n=1 Tax=Synechococcus sp. RSCCF101 TaxID=2511069 RepID=UPI001247AC45|nr:hypothetical protein [Synechococcus sp. RSCCF101]QEY31220.1 hypothetical protein EVJ50_02095 [Synechococcus sp. RSCCF101]